MFFFIVVRELVTKYLKNNLKAIAFVFGLLVLVGTLGSYLAEHSSNPGFQNLWESFWWTIVTVATVGYGDKVPVTILGRIIGIICMIGGPMLVASTIGSLGISLYNRWIKGERGMSQVKSVNHLIIFGWNSKAKNILAEIRTNEELQHMPVTIVDELIETKPVDDGNMTFVRGNATEMSILKQANVGEAKYAIVLACDSTSQADQKTVLTVLAIEKENPNIVTSAEINDMNNAEHLQRAGCDIIVNSPDLTSRMLAMSIQNSSITRVITDLISGDENELYRNRIPKLYVGKKYGQLLSELKQDHDVILIGLERDGKCILNPPSDIIAAENDYLLLIAQDNSSLGK